MIAPALVLQFPTTETDDRDLASALLLDFETAAIHETSDTEWRVFFRTADERDRAARALPARWRASAIDVEAEDWARKSQEGLKAITVGSITVAPPWDVPGDRPSQLTVVIEPSTGFGTGHHGTTRLCLAALQRLDVGGRRVLDVGTGSGVLAIAASMLGAAHVVAVDHDPDALATAKENAARNHVSIELRHLDFQSTRLEPADIVLANLTGAMLERNATELAALARGGHLIVSGLLANEADAVRAAFAPHASTLAHDEDAGWGSFTLTIP